MSEQRCTAGDCASEYLSPETGQPYGPCLHQQQPAAAATPGPEQRVAEIADDHAGCVASGDDLCPVPWLLDRLAAVEQERDTARTWSSLWKRTTTRYRRMLAIHRGRGWGTLAADNAALRSELEVSRSFEGFLRAAHRYAAAHHALCEFRAKERGRSVREVYGITEATSFEDALVLASGHSDRRAALQREQERSLGAFMDAWNALGAASTPRTGQGQAQEGHG